MNIYRILLLIVAATVITSCSEKSISTSKLPVGKNLDEFYSFVHGDDLLCDTVRNGLSSRLFYVRFAPFSLYGRVGVLVVTIQDSIVIKSDFIIDNAQKWVYPFSTNLMYKKLDSTASRLLPEILGVNIRAGDFNRIKKILGDNKDNEVLLVEGMDSSVFWTNQGLSLRLFNHASTISISECSDVTLLHSNPNWLFKSLTQDSLLPKLTLGLPIQNIKNRWSMRDTIVEMPELSSPSSMVMDYECWGIRGSLLLVFDSTQSLVGVFWNYNSIPEVCTELNYLYTGDLINTSFSKFYKPVIKKHFDTGKRMMAWHGEDESILFSYSEGQWLSFAHINTKIYSLPDHYK